MCAVRYLLSGQSVKESVLRWYGPVERMDGKKVNESYKQGLNKR